MYLTSSWEKKENTSMSYKLLFFLLNNIFYAFFFVISYTESHYWNVFFLPLSLTIVLRWNWKYFLYLIIYIPRHGITESLEIMRCWKEVDCFGIRLFIGNSVPFLFILNAIFSFFIISLLEDISSFVYFFFNGSKTCSWQRIKWDTFSSQRRIKRERNRDFDKNSFQ